MEGVDHLVMVCFHVCHNLIASYLLSQINELGHFKNTLDYALFLYTCHIYQGNQMLENL
jgi:hypothetical protein